MVDDAMNIKPHLQALQELSNTLFRAYATVLFAERPLVGGLFMLATLRFPNTALAGMLAALVALLSARLLKFKNLDSGLHIYNSLLVGLSLGATYRLDSYLALLICLAAVLAVFFTVTLSDALWRLDRLPVLSLPFVIVAFAAAFAARGYGSLSHYLFPLAPHEVFFFETADHFFTALGATFFIPHPVSGLLFFIGLLITSRYLTLLAVCGFLVGDTLYMLLSGLSYPQLSAWTGFNFILTAMALGGIFSVPSWQSFLLAMLGAALSAMISTATQTVMLIYGLPVMAIPFLLTTLTMLAALSKRFNSASPEILLEKPALPEISMERARLAKVRGLSANQLALAAPFMGEWTVYQGMNGEHTHQGLWQHALDFIITDEDGKSYQRSGNALEDFYCFGLPVLSPVYGTVVSCIGHLADNAPGEVDTEHNWGNFVLIQVGYQHHVLLAHLQQHSLTVKEGEWLHPGQQVGLCGNSGRSPQPHIHLHSQQEALLGSPTEPFVLSGVIVQTAQQRQFRLSTVPSKNDRVIAKTANRQLSQALHFPVGKSLYYRFRRGQDAKWQLRHFYVRLTLEGQFRLHSDTGASAAFIETDKVLAFYDRTGGDDWVLDMLILNLGLTPFVNGGLDWQDRPSVALLPLQGWRKHLYHLLPFGYSLKAIYQRSMDANRQVWKQTSQQHYRCRLCKPKLLATEAEIIPQLGCSSLRMTFQEEVFEAYLQKSGKLEDVGVPEDR